MDSAERRHPRRRRRRTPGRHWRSSSPGRPAAAGDRGVADDPRHPVGVGLGSGRSPPTPMLDRPRSRRDHGVRVGRRARPVPQPTSSTDWAPSSSTRARTHRGRHEHLRTRRRWRRGVDQRRADPAADSSADCVSFQAAQFQRSRASAGCGSGSTGGRRWNVLGSLADGYRNRAVTKLLEARQHCLPQTHHRSNDRVVATYGLSEASLCDCSHQFDGALVASTTSTRSF